MFGNKSNKEQEPNEVLHNFLKDCENKSRLAVKHEKLEKIIEDVKEGKFDPSTNLNDLYDLVPENFFWTVTTTIPMMSESMLGWEEGQKNDPDNELHDKVLETLHETLVPAINESIDKVCKLLEPVNQSKPLSTAEANYLTERHEVPIVPSFLTTTTSSNFRQIPCDIDCLFWSAYEQATERTGRKDELNRRTGRHPNLPRELGGVPADFFVETERS